MKSGKRSAAAFIIFTILMTLVPQLATISNAAITNYNVVGAPPALNNPAKGSTYTDPVFGTQILRLTDSSDGNYNAVAYSYWPTLNRNSTRLLITSTRSDGSTYWPHVYDFTPASFSASNRRALYPSGQPTLDFEGSTWSATHDNILWGVDNISGHAWLKAYNVDTLQYMTGNDSNGHPYSIDFTAAGHLPSGGTIAQMSKARNNDRFFSFHWIPSGGGQNGRYAVVYDRQTGTVYKWDSHNSSYNMPTRVNECRIDANGTYCLIVPNFDSYGTCNFRIWKFADNPSNPLACTTVIHDNAAERSDGHYDLGSTIMVNADDYGDVGNGMLKRPLSSPLNWTNIFAPDDHAWRNANHLTLSGPNEKWTLVSTYSGNPNYSVAFTNEIYLINTDGSGAVQRLAHHRSSCYQYGYEAMANLSPDGRFFAFNSDWGAGNGRCDVYIGRIPEGIWGTSPTPAPTPTSAPTSTPMPTPVPVSTKYEAENATPTGSDVYFENTNSGYTGTGYMAGFWNLGNALTFSVNTASAGSCDVIFRYANATGSARKISIYVNGVKIRQISLPNLASWSTWGNKTESLTLNAGSNTIALKYDSGDNGIFNIDYINVMSAAPTPAPTPTPTAAPVRYEAENAARSGGVYIGNEHAGYSGTGFVAGYSSVGAATTFTVNASSAGTRNVVLRYANAMGNTRTVSIYVNGVKIRQSSLPNMATWATWGNKTESLSLNAGSNTIAFRYDSGDSGNINIDCIDITP